LLYCQLIVIVCFVTGIGLFMYCILMGISLVDLYDIGNPLLYFGIGIMYSVVFIVKKYEHKIKGGDVEDAT